MNILFILYAISLFALGVTFTINMVYWRKVDKAFDRLNKAIDDFVQTIYKEENDE